MVVLCWHVSFFFFNEQLSVNVLVPDRGKVVGGLPDVVTIMEKKVSV